MKMVGKTIKSGSLHALLKNGVVYLAFKRNGPNWSAVILDFGNGSKKWVTREVKGITGQQWIEKFSRRARRGGGVRNQEVIIE